MDYDISHRIDEILLEKANEGIIGMGRKRKVSKKRSGSKTSRKPAKRVTRKRVVRKVGRKPAGSKISRKRVGSKTAKKKMGSKRGKGVYAGCDCGMGEGVYAGVYAGAKRKRMAKGSKTAKKHAMSKSTKKVPARHHKKHGLKRHNPWLEFVHVYWEAHPNMSYRSVISSPKVKSAYHKMK